MYDLLVPGYATEGSLALIEAEVNHLPEDSIILEIGSYLGRVTKCLAETAPKGKIYAVDIWNQSISGNLIRKTGVGFDNWSDADLEPTLENFRKWVPHQNVNTIKVNVSQRFDGLADHSVDFIFLDGNAHKPFFSDDLWFYCHKLKANGVIMGSNLTNQFEVNQELKIFAAAVNGVLSFNGHNTWKIVDIDQDVIMAKRYVVEGYKFKWYKEQYKNEDSEYFEVIRKEVMDFRPFRSHEAEFINKHAANHSCYIDLGCWGGVLAEKVIAGGKMKQAFIFDTSTSLLKIAESINPTAFCKSITIVSNEAEIPIICAERGRSLYGTSPDKRYHLNEDLVRLKIGETYTPVRFFDEILPLVDFPIFLKIDINCYEHLLIEELCKRDVNVIGIHSKIQTRYRQETIRILEKASAKFGLIKPPPILSVLNSQAYATISLTRNRGWYDIRTHNAISIALSEY